jgi:PAS domain S-box-containing protein
LFNQFVQVTETGQAINQEVFYNYEQFNGWFHQTLVKMGDGFLMNTEDITARKEAEQEILRLKDEMARQVSNKYYSLFNAIDEGFMVIELLYNNDNQPHDFRYMEVNPAFVQQSGLNDVTGKLISEVVPNLERRWTDTYHQILQTGEPVRFEEYNTGTKRWYNVYASRIGNSGSRELALVFSDITARKQDEQRREFMMRLSDALRPLVHPVAVQATATRLTMRHFDSDRCFYCEMIGNKAVIRCDAVQSGLLSVAGEYDMPDMPLFAKMIAAGKPFVIEDAHYSSLLDDDLRRVCLQLQVSSFLSVPVIKNGQAVGLLCIAQGTARQWATAEVSLAAEVAERIWTAIERSRAEAALRLSEERLRLFVSASSNLLYVMSANFRQMNTLTVNNYLLETTEPVTSWVDKYIPETARARVWDKIDDCMKHKKIFELEHQVFLADGSVGWMFSRAVPMLDDEGNITEWMGAGSDITTRKQAQLQLQQFNTRLENEIEDRTAELRQTKELLQATLDSNPELIQVFKAVRNADGRITDFEWTLNNATATQTYGDIIGKRLLDINPGTLQEGVFEKFVEVAETGIPQQYDLCYVHEQFDGWFHQSVVKLGDGVATNTINITERKRAEEGLKQSRDQLQSIFDTTLIGISVLAPVFDEQNNITDFRILIVNKKIKQSAGALNLQGQLYSQLFPGIKKMGLFDLMVKTFESGEPGHMEYHYNYDGIDCWYSTMYVKGDDALVCTNLDITKRMQAEQERFKNYFLLQQSEQLSLSGSWDFDLVTGITNWSEGMYRLFGLQQNTEVTPEIYTKFATPDCQPVAKSIVTHLRTAVNDFEETLKITVNDAVKIIHLKATVVKDEQGQPVRVLGVNMDVTAAREAERRLRHMEAEQQQQIFKVTLNTQEEERRRISESLHSGVVQLLYAAKLSLSLVTADAALTTPGQFTGTRKYTEQLLGDAISETRRISHELMPSVLAEFGLKAAILDICEQLQDGVRFRCQVLLYNVKLDHYLELAVFRTVQELMMNVLKHASATQANVQVKARNGEVSITVQDNGKGLVIDKQSKPGIGLSSIRSKAELLKGSVEIWSEPGQGTRIDVRFPYQVFTHFDDLEP